MTLTKNCESMGEAPWGGLWFDSAGYFDGKGLGRQVGGMDFGSWVVRVGFWVWSGGGGMSGVVVGFILGMEWKCEQYVDIN